MPKRASRRRFDEPRRGVSQAMVEAEARELQRELDSYLVQSLTDLNETSQHRSQAYRNADDSLRMAVDHLPERERRAVMCMLGRDLYLVLEVYLAYVGGLQCEAPIPVANSEPTQLPFSEWLFGS
jgi:hypothetical protein